MLLLAGEAKTGVSKVQMGQRALSTVPLLD